MPGNKIGAAKSRTVLLEQDPDYFRKLGSLGGSVKGIRKGFALMERERVSEVGRKGGRISRRVWTEEAREHHSRVMTGKNKKVIQ